MSFNSPFLPYYENDKVKQRLKQRIQRTEQVRQNLVKLDENISDKDKYITRRGQENTHLPGYYPHNDNKDKVLEKYEKISVMNQNQEHKEDENKIQVNKYFDNYVNNVKAPEVDFMKEKKEFDNSKKEQQKQIKKDWDQQIKTDNEIRDKIEDNYRQRYEKEKNIYDERYIKNEMIRKDKIKRNAEDYLNTNTKLINDKREKFDKNKKEYYDYEIGKAKENQKELDYLENQEKQYIKEQKQEFNRILDDQVKEQQMKYKKLRDIEYGNF
jgi:hypothetical protein